MANMSTYLEDKVLNHTFRNTEYVGPTTVYCGILDTTATASNLEAGVLTGEVTAYTGNRKPVTFSVPDQVLGKATIKNTANIEFDNMPAVTVKFAIISDAATAGNILYWVELDSTKTANAGDTFRIPANELVLDLD